ncbi:MAG: hypothetical protein OXN85_06270 [Gemmatimonadetes bacterium]|nr:hypothetical protein [Candidatus Palauibacter australiensis]
MKRFAAPFMAVTATMACAVQPLIMTRPAGVQAGGLDCVRVTLQRLGYMITAGDRSLGFVRAERMRTREAFPTGHLITDALVVNYISAGTMDDNSDNVIQVKVAKVGEHRDRAPAREAISDAEHLLDRCGKL